MKHEYRLGRWTVTFIKVRRGRFNKVFKIDKQKGAMVFLVTMRIGRFSLYIRRGWYPACKIKGRLNTFTK